MYAILGMIFYLSLYVMRWLGAIGVIGIIAYPFGWWRHYIWLWLGFVVLGFIGAALLEKIQKEAEQPRNQHNHR